MSHRDERTWQYGDTRWLVVSVVLLAALAVGAWTLMEAGAVLVVVVAAFAGIVGLQLHLYRKRNVDDVQQRRHLQALMFLFSAFDVRAPLPSLTGWAITPELAATLAMLIRTHEPDVVLELGSGASTVVMGYAVEKNGQGRVISLDHSETYSARTRRMLARHALQSRAEVRHAPLKPFAHRDATYPWYDLDVLEDGLTIDMVFVDGPPHGIGAMARYPALPALYPYLSEDAVIVLDDADRADERAMVNRWREEHVDFELEFRKSPHGTAILRRTVLTRNEAAEAASGAAPHAPND